jgi:hypothetical protein
MISFPVHADIGLFTKSPGLSTNMSLTEAVFGSVQSMFAAEEARLGRGFHGLVPGKNLLRDRLAPIEGWERREQIEGAEILALEHPPPAEDVAIARRAGAVEAAAKPIEFLQDGDVVTEDVAVPDQEGRRRQRGDSAPDEINSGLGAIGFVSAPSDGRFGIVFSVSHHGLLCDCDSDAVMPGGAPPISSYPQRATTAPTPEGCRVAPHHDHKTPLSFYN